MLFFSMLDALILQAMHLQIRSAGVRARVFAFTSACAHTVNLHGNEPTWAKAERDGNSSE